MIKRVPGFLRSLLVLSTIVAFSLYIPVISIPFIDTGNHWIIAFLGLLFPVTLFFLVIITIFWIVLRSKWTWACLLVLLSGGQQILAVLAFNIPREFQEQKKQGALRIMQWNVLSWDQGYHKKGHVPKYREDMLQLVKKQNADILCFEEFFEPYENIPYPPNIQPIREMGYPYYYFVPSTSWKRDFADGIIIFSKFPISDSVKIPLTDATQTEHILRVDVTVNNQKIRIIATHLQSVRFEDEDYASISEIKKRQESGLKDSRPILRKLKMGYLQRYNQALLLQKEVMQSPYPVILAGDFNDVPNSSSYFKAKNDLQDTFLKCGFLIGQTFRLISPTLRIDYIFADREFKVLQQHIIHVPYSDHFPLIVDLQK